MYPFENIYWFTHRKLFFLEKKKEKDLWLLSLSTCPSLIFEKAYEVD